MARMVSKLTELIKYEIFGVFGHFIASVVDLFDIALGARSTNDVRWIAHPPIEPIKTLLRHSCR